MHFFDHYQNESSTSWQIYHNLSCSTPHVTVWIYNEQGELELFHPDRIIANNENKVTIEFYIPRVEGQSAAERGIAHVGK